LRAAHGHRTCTPQSKTGEICNNQHLTAHTNRKAQRQAPMTFLLKPFWQKGPGTASQLKNIFLPISAQGPEIAVRASAYEAKTEKRKPTGSSGRLSVY